MNCKSCGVVIEWAGINTTYIDAEQSPFCGNTSKKHEPASPVAQPENDSLEATHTDASTTFSSVAQSGAGWAQETMQIINKLTPDIKEKAFDPDWFLLRQRLEKMERQVISLPSSPSEQATSSKEIWAIVEMIHKIKGISDGAERQRWYDEIAGIFASPSGQAAAPTSGSHCIGTFWTEQEIAVIGKLSTKQEFSHVAVLRQALRNYQLLVEGIPSLPDKVQECEFCYDILPSHKSDCRAASPTGGAEPPQWANRTYNSATGEFDAPAAAELLKQSPVKFKHNGFEHAIDRMAQGIIDSHPGSTLTAAYRAVALELHSSISSRQPPAAEPSAWPSDLPANGTGAMNLITNFWTGDLKGLTKEGARIVDSLVAHVIKGLRADVSRLETLVGQLEKIILKKDSDAAGLREQLEQAKRPAQESAAG